MNIFELKQYYKREISEKELNIIMQFILDCTRTDLILKEKHQIDKMNLKKIKKMVDRRKSNEPLAQILEEWDFYGRPFFISKHNLIPRNESELLVDIARTYREEPPKRILDLGTGSGCLLITLLLEYEESYGVGVDLSQDALKTAQRNAVRHNLFKRCSFIQSDWTEALEGTFDMIIANPPYIESDVIPTLEPEVKDHEPILALDGGRDGLNAYRSILKGLKSYMTKKTCVLFEIGYNQKNKVLELIEDYGFSPAGVHDDLLGHPRIIAFGFGDNMKKNESLA